MPEYDYHCESCAHDFLVDLAMKDHAEKQKKHEIHCPKCGSDKVKHVIHAVTVVTSRKS